MALVIPLDVEASPQTVPLDVNTPVEQIINADYDVLVNKPQINGVELIGNKTSADLGIDVDVFLAEYGVTTYAEIQTALQAGKACFVVDEGLVYPLSGAVSIEEDGESINGFAFSNAAETGLTVEYCYENDVWDYAESDIGSYSKPSGGIPKSDLASSVQTSLDKADTALQTAPVTSVNSKTGAVSLSASDVGAVPTTDYAPEAKTPAMTQAVGVDSSGKLWTEPGGAGGGAVDSVNGQTGDVELDLDDIPDGTTYKRMTATQVNRTTADHAKITEIYPKVSQIEAVIPDAASSSNQLADKAFVTDNITQGTAIYRGSFATKAALLAVAWQTTDPNASYYVSNNDYAVVLDDETHSDECWRYLYVTGTGWAAQYKINESPLTQAQLDAINSGATAAIIGSVADKYVKPSGGIPASDLASAVQTSLGKADTALQGVPDTYRTAANQDLIDFNQSGFFTAPSVPYYERVPGGIHVAIQPCAQRMAAQPGFFYKASTNKLTIYNLMINRDPYVDFDVYTSRYYNILIKDDASDPHELTMDDADATISEFVNSDGTLYFAQALDYTDITSHMDFRLACQLHDGNGDPVYTFYSEQYRYTIANSAVTRVRLESVALQSGDIITEIGLQEYNSSSKSSALFRYASPRTNNLLSFDAFERVTIGNFKYLISDSFFSGRIMARIGVRSGAQIVYFGPTILNELIADHNITQGEYFSVFKGLFVATASIASGSAIVPGTNCTELDWADSAGDSAGKQSKITVSGLLKGDGNGNISAATPGTDYGTYSKPSGGIPDSDLTSAVQTSLGKADTAYQKPSGGIPAADLASGVIPTVPGAYASNPEALGTASPGSSTSWAKGDHVHPKPSAGDIGAAPAIHSGSISLSATWTGAGPYTQTVTVTGATVTSSSKVDLQPDATALAQLLADGVTALFITNNAGTLTATAIGAATTAALTIQCTVTEVSA